MEITVLNADCICLTCLSLSCRPDKRVDFGINSTHFTLRDTRLGKLLSNADYCSCVARPIYRNGVTFVVTIKLLLITDQYPFSIWFQTSQNCPELAINQYGHLLLATLESFLFHFLKTSRKERTVKSRKVPSYFQNVSRLEDGISRNCPSFSLNSYIHWSP